MIMLIIAANIYSYLIGTVLNALFICIISFNPHHKPARWHNYHPISQISKLRLICNWVTYMSKINHLVSSKWQSQFPPKSDSRAKALHHQETILLWSQMKGDNLAMSINVQVLKS